MRRLGVLALGLLCGAGAWAADLPENDFQASLQVCAHSITASDTAQDALTALGWQALGDDPARQARFATLFADGVAAATAESLATQAEWQAAHDQAQKLAGLLLHLPKGAPLALFFSPSQDAVFVVIKSPETPTNLRCYFAGPKDADAVKLIETMQMMDRGRGGIAAFSPFLRDVTIKQHGASTRIVIFDATADDLIGRTPHVGMGVSYYRLLE